MTNSIELAIEKLKSDLDSLEDNMDKYEYIMEYGDRLPELRDDDRIPMHQILGCQSLLWIKDFGVKTVNFKAYSEAKIVRGLAAMVLTIYNGKTKEEILSTDPKILNKLGIPGLLTAGRQNGIGNLIKKIYEIADRKTNN
jgi:cysteine desulfuration protein SufE